jgi:hypothetical protein
MPVTGVSGFDVPYVFADRLCLSCAVCLNSGLSSAVTTRAISKPQAQFCRAVIAHRALGLVQRVSVAFWQSLQR